MNFKSYLNSHFSGCRLLAETYDTHRSRNVKVFMLPGEFQVVGVSDGVDAWVAPTIINPFSCDVVGLLKRIASGETVEVVRNTPTGRPVTQPALQELPRRRRLNTEAPAQQQAPQRRRLARV